MNPESASETERPSRKRRAKPENSIKPGPSVTAQPPPSDKIPDPLSQRFIQKGRHYHFKDGTPAFTDRGTRLTTPSENTEVIRSLIQIAEARGWQSITLSGTERFRKEAWFSARLAGLDVRGYKPSALEQEHLKRSTARRATAHAGVNEPSPLIVGKLLHHGPAPYRDDPTQSMSYVVRIQTDQGEREIWGVDLERALKNSASRPQPGDEVGLRATGQKPVKIALGGQAVERQRKQWSIERLDFIEERAALANVIRDTAVPAAQAARSHPALIGTYMAMKAADLASRKIPDPEDRKRFIEIIRDSLADSIERGEPLQTLRLRTREHLAHTPDRSRSPTRE